MCTVTIIPFDSGLRLVINRDELDSREAALRPAVMDLPGGRRAAWPTDGQAGGTWIAVNDSGLVLALLNANPTASPVTLPEDRRVSRGMVIPSLIGLRDVAGAISLLEGWSLDAFAPFRLVAAQAGDAHVVADLSWDGVSSRVTWRPLSPVCFASSGLGDHLVTPRIELFERWGRPGEWTAAEQDEFHRHSWPERSEVSVMMRRPGARTVSITTVEASADRSPSMRYEDNAGTVEIGLADGASAESHRSVRAPC